MNNKAEGRNVGKETGEKRRWRESKEEKRAGKERDVKRNRMKGTGNETCREKQEKKQGERREK